MVKTASDQESGQAIRVLIVEREAVIRRGLSSCLTLDPEMVLAGSAGTAEEGYRLADQVNPDVALVGTTFAESPGLGVATELHRRHPALATIVVAERENDDELFGAIRAGAYAYTGRDVGEEELIHLIRRSAAGEYVINDQLLGKPYVAARVLDQFRNATGTELAPSSAFAPLTERELDILRKVSDGMTNAEIGTALGISAQTVKNYITSILRKLAVNDRTQAVVTALRRGWLTIDEQPTPNDRQPTPLSEGRSRRSSS